MQRYFALKIDKQRVLLDNSDLHHIKNVMRMVKNDLLEVVYQEKVYIAKILNDNYEIEVVSFLEENEKRQVKIVLAMALVKEQKFDLIIQKATELGVNEIIPISFSRSIVKLDDKSFFKKKERWEKILKEASEQSKRSDIPVISKVQDVKKLCFDDKTLKIVLSTVTNIKNLKNILQENNSYDTLVLVVGPEGGIAPLEEDYLIQKGFWRASLGDLILRTETAAITVLGMINYYLMR